ncbi:hypothetical protein KR026_007979 [Drosophila bipectinata]|nr:hypothetical protein KR026_007979 [Drosophila bipectinata]
MILPWFLLLCGILSTAAAPENSTSTEVVDPLAEADELETATLKAYLAQYDRQCSGNSELSSWLERIRRASKMSKNQLAEKIQVRIGFETYNERRLSLEADIDDRIEDLDSLIPQQEPNSKCSLFYQRQRTLLKKAKSLTNEKKAQKLKENSVSCPFEDYDYRRDDEEYIEEVSEEPNLVDNGC